jgi:hypothetical protein
MQASDFAPLMTNTVTILHRITEDQYGTPTWDTGTVYKALYTDAREFPWGMEGRDDRPSLAIYVLLEPGQAQISYKDRVVPSLQWSGLDYADSDPARIDLWVDPLTNTLIGQVIQL